MQHDLFTTDMQSAFVQTTSGVTLVSGQTGVTYRVMNLTITATSGCTVKLQSGGSTDLTPDFPIPASGSLVMSNPLGLFQNASGEELNTVVSSGADYQVMVTYREV
jgi:hypothetical protein